jgi:beta-galactosidase
MKYLFNDGWTFVRVSPDTEAPATDEWQTVEIPHDWLIWDVKNLYADGDGWYRKVFNITDVDLTRQRVFFHFDGVYMDTVVHINEKPVFEWKYGYTAFSFDATDALTPGKNEIKLKIRHRSPNTRWYSGAGIYRDVHMIIKNNRHILLDGIYISPRVENNRGIIEIDAELAVTDGSAYTLSHTVSDKDGHITAQSTGGANQTLIIDNPDLWDIHSPSLYTVTSELIIDGKTADTETNRTGFRTMEITTDRGFFLNGRHLKLNGMCMHHDLGALGAAVNRDALARQFRMLREMGVNAIRTSHNPPAKAFMELADEEGFLVISEFSDMWERSKTAYDYARFFPEWAERDVASWIRRDRNHPSVIMWSLGNEIYDTHADERGREVMQNLMALVRKHDEKCHAPATLGSNYMPWPNTQACADIIKLIGYNYAEYLYDDHHAAHHDWMIYGAETGSTVQSRGIYHFPLAQSVLADDDLQCSALGNSSVSWGALSVEACVTADRDAGFSLGQFVWTGFDYIGEPTPYHTKNSYFGHICTAGFKKDSFYIFQSAWTDYKTNPMLHIFPHWDHSPGQVIDVRVCSNAPSVELFLNHQSLGVRQIDHRHGKRIVADWSVPYEEGVLEAVAYDENGQTIAQTQRRSFTDAYALVIKAEPAEIPADPLKLVFVEISAADSYGNPVENANNRVTVSVTGGELVGMDNGDSTDYEPYKTNSRRMFSGKLLAMVRPLALSKNIKIRIESVGLIPAEADIKCIPTCDLPGHKLILSDILVNHENVKPDEIPVRAIKLTSSNGFKLGPDCRTTTVGATLFPANATYQDIVWRLTDRAGIDSPIASMEASPDGRGVTVTAKGDGELYVRCGVKNGGPHIALYSLISLSLSGLGRALISPYSFVTGGLYNASNHPMTNGNDRGVASLRDRESHIGFLGLDFGGYGSDEFTVGLFPLSNDPFPLEIWEGMPEDGGERIHTVQYDKGSVWNTYIDFPVQLPRRLTGITALCFVLKTKVHIGGFVFTHYPKAFRQLYAAGYDSIYGDSYAVNGDYIERIGNNVSLIYNDMDFGTTGTVQIEIQAASQKPHGQQNSMLAVFTDENGKETRVMLEIPAAKEYTGFMLPLGRRMTGRNTLSLIFLPGSDLDLAWFRFVSAAPIL